VSCAWRVISSGNHSFEAFCPNPMGMQGEAERAECTRTHAEPDRRGAQKKPRASAGEAAMKARTQVLSMPAQQ
jgi:hypothetical protein